MKYQITLFLLTYFNLLNKVLLLFVLFSTLYQQSGSRRLDTRWFWLVYYFLHLDYLVIRLMVVADVIFPIKVNDFLNPFNMRRGLQNRLFLIAFFLFLWSK